MAVTFTGSICKINGSFGFIRLDDPTHGDMFVIPQSCSAFGREIPPVGTRVKFGVVTDTKTGRPRADNVEPLDDVLAALAPGLAGAALGGPALAAGTDVQSLAQQILGLTDPSALQVGGIDLSSWGLTPEQQRLEQEQSLINAANVAAAAAAAAFQEQEAASVLRGVAAGGVNTGTVILIKGNFGFLKQDSGEADMFCLPPIPPVGTRVKYDKIIDPKTGRPRAENMQVIESAAPVVGPPAALEGANGQPGVFADASREVLQMFVERMMQDAQHQQQQHLQQVDKLIKDAGLMPASPNGQSPPSLQEQLATIAFQDFHAQATAPQDSQEQLLALRAHAPTVQEQLPPSEERTNVQAFREQTPAIREQAQVPNFQEQAQVPDFQEQAQAPRFQEQAQVPGAQQVQAFNGQARAFGEQTNAFSPQASAFLGQMPGFQEQAFLGQQQAQATSSAPGQQLQRRTGIMAMIKDHFGFIKQDSGEQDMFALPPFPSVGTRVSYEPIIDPKTGRMRAEHIQALDGSDGGSAGYGPAASTSRGTTRGQPYDQQQSFQAASAMQQSPSSDAMVMGTIAKLHDTFGFIKQDSGEPDMFLMPQSCAAFGRVLPPVGTRIRYQVVLDAKTGRPRAENVQLC
eukprot:CAMPEP_0117519564 /NCGR_PEP_ID=MMETSP0784-20121206/32715_1 /TAXON_ID=39447 /ORGANISM="" /LENGTH=628 /DNA_ID=CAMNT_0005315525 /DNA_START=1 /DNA_END=1887 /DNA_ORIENTATION=-